MKTLKNQNGIALIVAMGLLLMVSLIGLAAVLTSDTETDISVNKKNDTKAFYTAEGGLEWGHADIKEAVNAIDTSALESLEAINHRLKDGGIALHLSEVKGPVMDRLKRSHFLQELTGKVHLSQYEAVASINPELARSTRKAERAPEAGAKT